MIPEQPTDIGGAPLGPDPRWGLAPKAMLRQVALRKMIDAGLGSVQPREDIDLWRAHNISANHPAIWRGRRCYREPLTGLALRLFAASNGFHECRSETID